MYIIVGLGNPSPEYAGTRHNAGFEVVQILADRFGIETDYIKHRAICGKGVIEGSKVMLAMPQTFMNLSGESVRMLVDYYKIDVSSELIVIYDDVDLPVGRIRVRESGSAGGHNGMKDIIAKLGTEDFIRVRVGVGAKPEQWDLADWVLSRFPEEDVPIMKEARVKAAAAVSDILINGAEHAMSQYNG